MNIQLTQAVTDVMGVTGQAIIRSIVEGERNARVLSKFRDPNCKHSEEEIEKALTGTWREEHLYVLKQSLELYDFYTEQIEACDEEISRQYGVTRPACPDALSGEWGARELPAVPEKKRNSHSKTCAEPVEAMRRRMPGRFASICIGSMA